MTIRLRSVPALAFASWLLTGPAAFAAPSDVDDTFGNGGIVSRDAGRLHDVSQGVVVGADYIYLLANGNTIMRFTPDGVPDPEFGTNGVLRFSGIDFVVTAIGEDPAGGLFLGGNKLSNVAVARIRFDGTLDDDFGDAGYAIIDTAGAGEVRYLRYYNLHVWILGSTTTDGGDARDAFVAKLDQAGNPDFGWGLGGVALVNFGTACDEASFFTVETAGFQTVLVGGDTSFGDCAQQDLAIARLNPLGELAPSLGDTGIKLLDLGGRDTMGVVVAQTTGANKIAFSGLSAGTGGETRQVIGRLTSDGDFDPTFGGDGKQSGALPAIGGFAFNGTTGVQSLGQLVYAGNTDGGNVAITRLEGSTQLSIDDVGAGNGGGGGDDGGTVLSGVSS